MFTQLLKIRREYTEIYLLEVPSFFFGQLFPHLDAVANHLLKILVAAPAYSGQECSDQPPDRIEVKRDTERGPSRTGV